MTGENKVFYFQKRVGRNGKVFSIIKSRYYVERQSGFMGARGFAQSLNDPRFLPLGKFLRKTKLNELPQLVNVLKGDMSLGGILVPLLLKAIRPL